MALPIIIFALKLALSPGEWTAPRVLFRGLSGSLIGSLISNFIGNLIDNFIGKQLPISSSKILRR